jgi:hypothetical protein
MKTKYLTANSSQVSSTLSGYRELISGVNRAEREADSSPLSNADVKLLELFLSSPYVHPRHV